MQQLSVEEEKVIMIKFPARKKDDKKLQDELGDVCCMERNLQNNERTQALNCGRCRAKDAWKCARCLKLTQD